MTLQAIKGGMHMPRPVLNASGAPTVSVIQMDAASEKACFIFQAQKTGTIAKIYWRIETLTTQPTGGVDLRLETVDLATGFPTGTLWGTNTNVTVTPSAAGSQLSALTAGASVTKGDFVAVVWVNPATNFGDWRISLLSDEASKYMPYAGNFTGGSWSANASSPIGAIEYSDGSYEFIDGLFPVKAFTTRTFNNSSTPDVRGIRFKVPFPCRVSGFWVWWKLDGDATVKLIDSDGATVLTSLSCDKDVEQNSTGSVSFYTFPSSVNLAKDTYYRFVVEPNGATSMSMYEVSVDTAAQMDGWQGGQDFHLTTAKDPTGDADYTNTNTSRYFMGLVIDAFDDGAGSGSSGGRRPRFRLNGA